MPVSSPPASGFAPIPLWAIIAFFVVDTVIVMAVVFWAINRNKSSSNNLNTFGNPTGSPLESAFSSSSTGDSEILDLLRRGQKLEAIKIYRERTKCGLKEAKDVVEAMERQNR